MDDEKSKPFNLDTIPPIRLLGDMHISVADKLAVDRAMQHMSASVVSSHIDPAAFVASLQAASDAGTHPVIVIDSWSTISEAQSPQLLVGGSMGLGTMAAAVITALTISEAPEASDDHYIPRKYKDYQQPKHYGPPRKKRW